MVILERAHHWFVIFSYFEDLEMLTSEFDSIFHSIANLFKWHISILLSIDWWTCKSTIHYFINRWILNFLLIYITSCQSVWGWLSTSFRYLFFLHLPSKVYSLWYILGKQRYAFIPHLLSCNECITGIFAQLWMRRWTLEYFCTFPIKMHLPSCAFVKKNLIMSYLLWGCLYNWRNVEPV